MNKTIEIDGMMCNGCSSAVKEALEALDGVTSATADHTTGKAVVELSAEVSDEILTKAVEDLEFTVIDIQ